MTSVKAIAAAAVVIIVLCAGGAYAVMNMGDDSPRMGEAIDRDVSVGDSYTLQTQHSAVAKTLGYAAPLAASGTETTYLVVQVDGDSLKVEETTNGVKETVNTTKDEFLDEVSIVKPVGQYQRTESISTPHGVRDCDVYFNKANVGNGDISISTLEWIGHDTNIIYKTEITLTSGSSTEIYTTTLVDTNMIGKGEVPSAPSIDQTVRTDVKVGDYIEFSKYEDRDDREIVKYTVLRIDGDRLLVTDDYDDDWDDAEWMTESAFLAMIKYDGRGKLLGSETISTGFGDIACDKYELQVRGNGFDFDHDEEVTAWVGKDNGVIYKLVAVEYDDDRWDHDRWQDDVESYYLTGTSLFYAGAPESGTDIDSNRYDVELAIGDYYVIKDGNETEKYEIIGIESGRLIVKVSERNDVEIERMSSNEFLSDIMVTDSQLESMKNEGPEDGFTKYTKTYADGDRKTIWVDDRNIVHKVLDIDDDGDRDLEQLVDIGIASL